MNSNITTVKIKKKRLQKIKKNTNIVIFIYFFLLFEALDEALPKKSLDERSQGVQ